MLKRALLVGIDKYDAFSPLSGCVNDVNALYPLLRRNYDGSINFSCQTLTSDRDRIERETLLTAIDHLLAPGADVALLYFAGHGTLVSNNSDVALATQNGTLREPGVSMSDILTSIQNSNVDEVIILLDCCFSGAAGQVPRIGGDTAMIKLGSSILTASRSDQTSAETTEGRGLFSTYLCGALDEGAADVMGLVNQASTYAYLSECFNIWNQRPTLKANVDRLHVLRKCKPAVAHSSLIRIREFFVTPDDNMALDPSYEPEAEPSNAEHEEIFGILQRCRAAKLVEPVDHEHMYHAAMDSGYCRLTPLGKHYWMMIENDQI